MHHSKLKAAVKKYSPLNDEGQTEEEIRAAMDADGYSVDEANQIYDAIVASDGSAPEKKPKAPGAEKAKAGHEVILQFRDKHDQKIYNTGDDYRPRDDDRAADLIKRGIIKKKG